LLSPIARANSSTRYPPLLEVEPYVMESPRGRILQSPLAGQGSKPLGLLELLELLLVALALWFVPLLLAALALLLLAAPLEPLPEARVEPVELEGVGLLEPPGRALEPSLDPATVLPVLADAEVEPPPPPASPSPASPESVPQPTVAVPMARATTAASKTSAAGDARRGREFRFGRTISCAVAAGPRIRRRIRARASRPCPARPLNVRAVVSEPEVLRRGWKRKAEVRLGDKFRRESSIGGR
jgi:hypothetical protein